MEFMPKVEFTAPMLEQYPQTLKLLRHAKKRRAQFVLDAQEEKREPGDDFFQWRFREALRGDKEFNLISEMLADASRAYRTARYYYEPGGRWDEAYCNLSRISGSPSFGCESIVEKLVIDRLCPVGRQEQRESDEEFEARADRILRGLNGTAVVSAETILVRGEEAGGNLGDSWD